MNTSLRSILAAAAMAVLSMSAAQAADHVYTDGQGRYLLHHDANYDPGTDPALNQVDWTRIEPAIVEEMAGILRGRGVRVRID